MAPTRGWCNGLQLGVYFQLALAGAETCDSAVAPGRSQGLRGLGPRMDGGPGGLSPIVRRPQGVNVAPRGKVQALEPFGQPN